MPTVISADTLKLMLHDEQEISILDVREQGSFGMKHLFYASCLPYSQFEMRILDLVPRFGTRAIIMDSGEGLALKAAIKMESFGYNNVHLLFGGVKAWERRGFEVFSGISVPSKAFGELVEGTCKTPSISPEELKARQDRNDNLIVLDARTFDEYVKMTIPGSINVPGAELAYQIGRLVKDTETLIVVNCAGRTRSIIGAQSLINAGITNPIRALRNGTMGWHLAGFQLEKGATRRTPIGNIKTIHKVNERSFKIAKVFGIKFINYADLKRWKRESLDCSLYLLDVRTSEEYALGHLPGSINAPGGQLIQNTDFYLGTLGARLVLIDDNGVRATMTASWLLQMGWKDTVVLNDDREPKHLETGAYNARIPGWDNIVAEPISPWDLNLALVKGEATVIDISLSQTYKFGHITGAWHSTRASLERTLLSISHSHPIVLVSEDGRLSRIAASEVSVASRAKVRYLSGGMAAWRDQGYPQSTNPKNLSRQPDDYYLRAYDRDSGVEQAMNDYLEWEIGLIQQIQRDGQSRFNIKCPMKP